MILAPTYTRRQIDRLGVVIIQDFWIELQLHYKVKEPEESLASISYEEIVLITINIGFNNVKLEKVAGCRRIGWALIVERNLQRFGVIESEVLPLFGERLV